MASIITPHNDDSSSSDQTPVQEKIEVLETKMHSMEALIIKQNQTLESLTNALIQSQKPKDKNKADDFKLEVDLTRYEEGEDLVYEEEPIKDKEDKAVALLKGKTIDAKIAKEEERYLKQVKENERLQAQLKFLEHEVQAMKMGNHVSDYSTNTLLASPKVEFPPKFKCPIFTHFKGDSNPLTHMVIYQGELGQYENDDALKVKLFQKSLGRKALDWFVLSGAIKIKTWDELFNAFVNQYSILITEALEKSDLEKERKKPNESFREYATRWSDLAVQVYPPLDNKAKVKSFLETLEAPFYGPLMTMKHVPFPEFVKCGIDIELGFASGKLKDYSLLEAMAERIETGALTRKNGKKREEDVSLILHQQQGGNRSGGAANKPN
jgi:hypothetical protein